MSVYDCPERHFLTALDAEKIDAGMPLQNPVVESSKFAYETTDLVKINENGIKVAANYVRLIRPHLLSSRRVLNSENPSSLLETPQ
ncbi:hypothetical protein AN958_03712 [Leucoagaricus sp. SymC.cos]|nr:hypothetical protein AN958_03712 [Leucoagaricus sp. SymC.cos]